MWTRCLGGFSVMRVKKLWFLQEKLGFFAQNWHFCSFWAKPCWLIWWVGWWLWRAGCISQDTYLIYYYHYRCHYYYHHPPLIFILITHLERWAAWYCLAAATASTSSAASWASSASLPSRCQSRLYLSLAPCVDHPSNSRQRDGNGTAMYKQTMPKCQDIVAIAITILI